MKYVSSIKEYIHESISQSTNTGLALFLEAIDTIEADIIASTAASAEIAPLRNSPYLFDQSTNLSAQNKSKGKAQFSMSAKSG